MPFQDRLVGEALTQSLVEVRMRYILKLWL